MTVPVDPRSVAGMPLAPPERTQLLVLGAGPAGLAAAAEGARCGLSVTLVDEHPLDAALMGMDVPFHFGQRMDGSVQNRARMLERIAGSDPAIEEAFALGVDVRLATDLWGVFANGPGVRWLPGKVAGLAGDGKSWLLGFDRIVIAAGRRDMGISFPGWELPGVMGMTAAHTLIDRYCAFNGSRIVIIGSGAEALSIVATALARGLTVAAVIEVTPVPSGPERLVARLRDAGVPLLTSTVPLFAEGDVGGVRALCVASVDCEFRPVVGTEQKIACDTVCLGVGAVPNVEALDVLGCQLSYRENLGGFVPELGVDMRTTLSFAYAAGDCIGMCDEKSIDPDIARAEGRKAALGAAHSIGAMDAGQYAQRVAELRKSPATMARVADYRSKWVRALTSVGEDSVLICQCEEVSRGDLLGLRPPRYLGCDVAKTAKRDLASLIKDGPVNQDQVKRLTRAGMGQCQGRRCREQAAILLALASGVSVGRIPLASYRPPLRPLPLSVIEAAEEHVDMAAHWDAWFGIESQWRPYWDLKTKDERTNEPPAYGK